MINWVKRILRYCKAISVFVRVLYVYYRQK